MITREKIVEEIESLSEAELEQVARYLALVKCCSHSITGSSAQFDETYLAALYAECAETDRELAEAGLSDYASGLAQEDTA